MKEIDFGLIDDDFFEVLEMNLNVDYTDFLLSGRASGLNPELKSFVAVQLKTRKSLNGKLDSLLENPRFLVPDSSVAEQATNEAVASYNASLAEGADTLTDLTAGMGIDVIKFSSTVKEVTAIERDEWRSEVLRHNLKILGIRNVKMECRDAESFLQTTDRVFDIVYIDPARREDSGKRVFLLQDSQPDVEKLLPILRKRCRRLIVKASPLLDLKETFQRLPGVSIFHIVEYKRECKEILIEIDFSKPSEGRPAIRCVEVKGENDFRIFDIETDRAINKIYFSASDKIENYSYIYEPSPSLLKSGFQDVVFILDRGLRKLDVNTHLYVSEEFIEDFPGRSLRIQKAIDGKEARALKNQHLNVIARNYPLKADMIFKKYNILPGRENYLLACRIAGKPTLILAKDGR